MLAKRGLRIARVHGPGGWEKRSFADSRTSYRRYIPAAGRFLIVCTFMEDAIRIMTQWSDQLLYLKDYQHSKILTARFGFPTAFPMVILTDC